MTEIDLSQYGLFAGVDEAGRGPLAGPVVAGAVILDPENSIEGLMDSKKLSPEKREFLYVEIKARALDWGLGVASVEEIDRVNILQATYLAMQRAVNGLRLQPDYVLVDGNRCPDFACPANAIIKGDTRIAAISAASILAKVSRDTEMVRLDAEYPGYGLARHKGYPSKQHVEALENLGVTPIHRVSYAPVRRVMEKTR
jgi:ribonuclease HII